VFDVFSKNVKNKLKLFLFLSKTHNSFQRHINVHDLYLK